MAAWMQLPRADLALWEHGLMMPVMLIPMLHPIDVYAGRTGHGLHRRHVMLSSPGGNVDTTPKPAVRSAGSDGGRREAMATMRQRELSDFLVRLGDEPDLFEEYVKNRAGVLEREGLARGDRDAILSGDLREIRARLRNGHSEPEAMVVMEGEPEREGEPEPEEPPTVMEPEEPPTVMEPEPEEPKAG
jgi:hypothetical protein